MANQSKRTKTCRAWLWIWRIADAVCLISPIFIYVLIALIKEDIVIGSKVAVVCCLLISIIMIVVNSLAHKRLRCPIWIMMIGLFVAVKEMLLPLIIIIAITAVLDDLVFTPLIGHYRTALIANKEIDKRVE